MQTYANRRIAAPEIDCNNLIVQEAPRLVTAPLLFSHSIESTSDRSAAATLIQLKRGSCELLYHYYCVWLRSKRYAALLTRSARFQTSSSIFLFHIQIIIKTIFSIASIQIGLKTTKAGLNIVKKRKNTIRKLIQHLSGPSHN